ncbi:MAG: DUF4352 domain-containing protein [Cenarchaeum sp. SB0661_bin_35]|nr:DUF4352 domain-containing protein [Cenarchaeum sp. SB0661_bin_35]
MIQIGMVIVLGAVIGSMAIALYAYVLYQPNIIEVSHGEPVVVGPIEYAIVFEDIHDGIDDARPNDRFVKIRINMMNVGTESATISGGQFYFVDTDGERHWPVYGNGTFGQEDLLRETLQSGEHITRTTQFDVPYMDDETYSVIIRPAKEHNSMDMAVVCITNC